MKIYSYLTEHMIDGLTSIINHDSTKAEEMCSSSKQYFGLFSLLINLLIRFCVAGLFSEFPSFAGNAAALSLFAQVFPILAPVVC